MMNNINPVRKYFLNGIKIFLLTSFIAITITVFLVPYNIAFAQVTPATQFSDFLGWLFTFTLSVAAILAVLMIVIGGLQLILSGGNVEKRSNAKKRITQALFGLLLALAAWLVLYTINPDLVKGGFSIPSVTVQSNSTPQQVWYRCILTLTSTGLESPSRIRPTLSECNISCNQIVAANPGWTGLCIQIY